MSDEQAETLLMELLRELRKDVKSLVSQGQTFDVRMAKLEVHATETVKRLDIGNERMDVANGRTSKNELAIEQLRDQVRETAAEARGEAKVRQRLTSRLELAAKLTKEWGPWALALALTFGGGLVVLRW